MNRRSILILLIFFLAAAVFVYRNYYRTSSRNNNNIEVQVGDNNFNRNETRLILTKHAKCRMACRHIEEKDILDILKNGKINYEKSDLHGKPDPKYAVEGEGASHQRLRIIFAPTSKGMVVVTCIDLDTDWACDCS